jgi:hypothetical protein
MNHLTNPYANPIMLQVQGFSVCEEAPMLTENRVTGNDKCCKQK